MLSAVVAVAAIAVYAGVLSHDFVMDDWDHIVTNRWIRSPGYLGEVFTSGLWGHGGEDLGMYRPLIHVLFMATYGVVGLEAVAFHLVNVVLHAGASLLLFLTLCRWLASARPLAGGATQLAAFAGALLFAVHPIHVEPVAWVSGVMDVSAGFFSMLALFLYPIDGEPPRRRLLAAAFAFFLGLLCKEPVVALPGVLVALDWVGRRPFALGAALRRYAPFAVALATYAGLRVYALHGVAPGGGDAWGLADIARNTVVLFARYLQAAFVPTELNVWHVFAPVTRWGEPRLIVSVLVVAAVVVISARSVATRGWALPGLALLIFPLLPALYLPGLTQGVGNAFAERYLYVPSMGAAMIVALGLASLPERVVRRGARRAGAVAAVVAVAVSGATATVLHARVWQNTLTLWTDAESKSPDSYAPAAALGDYYVDRGLMAEAEAAYRRAAERATTQVDARANLASVLWQRGAREQALREIHRALAADPESHIAHNHLGVFLCSSGEFEAGLAALRRAVELAPYFQIGHKNLGMALQRVGSLDESVGHLRRAVELNPDDADAHNALGVSYARANSFAEAAAAFGQASRLAPEDAAFRANLERARFLMNGR